MPGQLQITPFCAPQQMDDENPLISAGLRAVIQSPLRCGSYGPLSRLTVFLCIGALWANIRICRIGCIILAVTPIAVSAES